MKNSTRAGWRLLRTGSRLRVGALLFSAMIIAAGGFIAPAAAHEPVFSVGPETIYKGGLGIEVEFEFERGGSERFTSLHYELLYGLTPDLSFTLSVPSVLDKKVDGASSGGLGDIQLRGKYRLMKRDTLGASDKVSLVFGVKLPTGNENKVPPLGTGAKDYLLGLSAGHESRTWYRFATVRYLFRTGRGDAAPGDVFLYDAAIGFRPWLREYLEWDFVMLLELSGELEMSGKFAAQELPDSGGNTIWLGPSGLWSYRNFMIKGGIQVPVVQNLRGDQPGDDFRLAFAVEYHI